MPDELFPVVKMEPKRSYDVEISTPGRIAALEAEVERLRAHEEVPGLNHNIPAQIDWILYSEHLEQTHHTTWQERDENYWLQRLVQEVGELASALAADHDDPPEWELMQIRAIAGNWLRKRQHAALEPAQALEDRDE